MIEPPAQASGTFRLGGDLSVTRMGFGAMRITGAGIWGTRRTGMLRSRCCGARSTWGSI